MNFKIIKEESGKYIWLDDIKLMQGLKTLYRVSDKKILIVDPDSKDYNGQDYTDKAKIEEKEYGIVQNIDIEAVIAISELARILRTIE